MEQCDATAAPNDESPSETGDLDVDSNYSLTLRRLTTTIWVVPHSYPPDAAFYLFIQQISVLNILNILHNLLFFLFKMPFIS